MIIEESDFLMQDEKEKEINPFELILRYNDHTLQLILGSHRFLKPLKLPELMYGMAGKIYESKLNKSIQLNEFIPLFVYKDSSNTTLENLDNLLRKDFIVEEQEIYYIFGIQCE
ncbi:hypothetical protein KG091_00585 [Carnobacteriaceae bacterium zg-ZUI78]|nr:hypothetical protein [Carnobacteriaceae bacterium zg-ZUI78]